MNQRKAYLYAAVGGTYTFTYNAVTNLLVIGYSK